MSIIKMVSEFSVAPKCVIDNPCLHECSITLSDGRKLNVELKGSDVFCFIHQLPKQTKVKNIWSESHFAKYSKEVEGPAKEKVEKILKDHFK